MTSHLQAKFLTKVRGLDLTDAPFSVPDSAAREELNELVNQLISETNTEWAKKQFDFLIQHSLLRGSLKEFMQENELSTDTLTGSREEGILSKGMFPELRRRKENPFRKLVLHWAGFLDEPIIGLETVLEIECMLRDVPQPHADLPHDDWVGAVRTTTDCIIAGCYDNTVHIWSHNGKRLSKIPAHTGAVKCLGVVPSAVAAPNATRFATGSQDQTIALWDFDTGSNEVVCELVGKGHERSVECLCSNTDGSRLASGGFDGFLKIWNTVVDSDNNASSSLREQKRMKTENSRSLTTVPMVTLSGHREAVTGCCWTDQAEVTTASMDRSIIVWDLELAGQKDALTCAKAFTSIAYSPLSRTLVTGCTDRHVRLWDPRSKEGAMVKMTFSSHNAWVVDVDWNKTNEHTFVSASYDKIMKMWDTRSPKAPLYDLSGHDDRLLCCDWSIPEVVVSGGVDDSVKVFRTCHQPNSEITCEF